MAGSGLGGLAEGLWGYVDRERQLSQERENTAAQKEAQLYSLLAEHGTDEFASMGLAGLAEMANPKRKAKGMRGFFGEMEASQTLPRIRELMATPQQRAVTTPGLPSKGIPVQAAMGMPPAPTGGQGRVDAAMAGQPPPGPMPMQTPGQAFTEQRGTPQVGRVDQVSGPRQVLMGTRERQIADTRRAMQAAGIPEAEIQRAIVADVGGRYALYGPGGVSGGGVARADIIPDEASPTGFSRPLYDKRTGQVVGSLPAMDPRKTGAAGRGIDRGDPAELAAGQMGFANSEAVPRERYGELVEKAQQIAKDFNYQRGVGTGEAREEAGLTRDQQLTHTRAMQGTWFRLQQPVIATKRALATMDAGMAAVERGDLSAGSEAIIVTFEKILDSLSVVRESEYLRPLSNQSLIDRAQGAFDRIRVGGAGMTAEQLKSYARLAKEIAGNVEEMIGPAKQMLRQTATTYQLDPNLITGPEGPATQTGAPPPAAPGAAAAPKTATMAQVRAFATANKVDEAQAIAQAERDGFTITDKPQ